MCRKVVWFVCLFAAGWANAASAATWTNADPADDSWCTAGNWSPPGSPGPTDTAVISTPTRGPIIDCDADVDNINGPMWGVSSNQVMDITSGFANIRGEWSWRSGTGTATININGIPYIIINNGWWRAPDNGTGIINIGGDPIIWVNGEWRGADGSGSWLEVNMSGGYVRAQSFKFGDDGDGLLNMSGGRIDVVGDLKITSRPVNSNITISLSGGSIYTNDLWLPAAEVGVARGTAILNMTGGLLSVSNEFKAPGQDSGKAKIYLHGGTVECGSFTHAGAAYSMDITQGTMTIAGNMSSQINSDIAAGYITAYGSDGTVNVDLVDGNTVITASPPDPNLASNPDPPDRGIVFGTEATLCWSPGINAVWHDVYLGTDFNDVNDDADPNVLPGRGRQDSNSFYVSGLTPGQTYYWRIDEVNSLPPYKGKIWNFTVVETYTNSLGMLFVRIPPGTFTMGQGDGHRIQDSGDLDYDEQPEHLVKISKPFYILAATVADVHYQQSGLPGSASDVSWNDANAFAQWLSNLEGKTYHLPTEAQWQYVCQDPGHVQDMSNREWVQDWHGLYGHNALLDPAGPLHGILKVIRADAQNRWSLPTNASYQPWQLPEAGPCGFRLVLEDDPPEKNDVACGPFCQAAVKQSTAVALQGPDPNTPYFTVRFAIPIPPDNATDGIASMLGCDPTVTWHNHSPGFEVLPNGDALAVWFTGGSEVGPEVRFVQARLRYGSDQWDMPELFYDMKGMSTTSGLLWTEADRAVRFFGGGRITNADRRPFVMAVSTDNGATWDLKRPYFPIPAVNFTAQPVVNAWRQDSNTIYMVMDGYNPSSSSFVWRSPDNGTTWYDMGGRTNGRHSTILPIGNSGELLSYGGKSSNIDGWMPYCKSDNWGATWPEAGPAPFAVLGGNQRPCMTRLANGKLVFICDCQRKGDNYQPPGWLHGYGCLIAISDNNGVDWHFKKFPVTLPHESDRQYGTLGYSTVRQAPNGVIHVLTTMTHPCLHYELNEAWIYSGQGDIPPETTGGTVNQYSEYYPGGALKATWSARTCPNGRYLLHGTETSYYENGKKEHQVTYNNGRKTGAETFWQPDDIKLWSWQHDDVNNISIWRHYWSNGFMRIESRWNSYPAARDLPSRRFSGFVADGAAYHWYSSGRPAKAYNFSNGSYLGETSLSSQVKPKIDLETFVHHWLWTGLAGGDGYNEADFNKDGIVNFIDFAAFAAQLRGKGRVIEFGWDMPTIPWLHDNVTAAKATPFHGIILDLARREGQAGLSRYVWAGTGIASDLEQKAEEDIALLNAASLTRLRENSFLRINSSGYWPPPDWFDSDFNAVVSNIAFAAAAVNQTAFAGIAFDPEDYHFNPWYYPGLKYHTTKTFEQYQAQVRQRGRETASAIRDACPCRDFTLLFLFANSTPYISMQYWGHQLHETTYGLLPAFVDGLLDEAGDHIRLIDGMESAYPNKTLEDFYSSIGNHQGGSSLSADPSRYMTNVGIGFGAWMDYRSNNYGWYTDPNEFHLNHFTPQTFHQAMDVSTDLGEFSWVYTQIPDWYLGDVPQAYFDALADVTGYP